VIYQAMIYQENDLSNHDLYGAGTGVGKDARPPQLLSSGIAVE
jgi:hypothetical protein